MVDIIKADFDRSNKGEKPELAFEIANLILARVRVYARIPQIKPLVFERDSWRLHYLTDDLRELDPEEGKHRQRVSASVTVGEPAINAEIFKMVIDGSRSNEPYIWDQLLLDAYEHLPDVGGSVVMAWAALETFIEWALEILHKERPLADGLWTWINERGDWRKEPSVAERFDTLLTVLTHRSLKEEEPRLWEQFSHLKDARNAVAHEGVASFGKKKVTVDAGMAKEFVESAAKIIVWVEQLLSAQHRRSRTAAIGPCFRRLATSDEADALGPARLREGGFGLLAPGASFALEFESGLALTTATPEGSPPPVPAEEKEPPSGIA
jgi:hypothetical protein